MPHWLDARRPLVDETRGFAEEMHARFGAQRFRARAALAPLTTFKVGGPADWLIETSGSNDILAALDIAHRWNIPITVLGGGSNVLIADGGVRGLVIRTRGGHIEQPDERHVRADASTTINGLVRWTIHRGIAGLEAWAGTPGTVGGAVYGNAHFGGRLIGDLVESVRIADRDATVRDLPCAQMNFGYDRSRLQKSGEILLSAVFVVSSGDPVALREIARTSLAYRKQTQPLDTPSAGCIFQNPTAAQLPEGIPASAGALVDRAGLKGVASGGARISTAHANFIVNEGSATAADIRGLIELCRLRVREEFGLTLEEEIVFLGEF